MGKNFGDILNEWENGTAKPYGKKRIVKDKKIQSEIQKKNNHKKKNTATQSLELWLRRYGVENKDENDVTEKTRRQNINPEKIKIDAQIDLHGMKSDEAEIALEIFFAECLERRYKKVLIIHGKGKHSQDEPVLKKLVQQFIEQNKHAGKSGNAKAAYGGSGATWVLLK